jgi:hypothetical protein
MERDEIDETQREAKEKRSRVCTYGTVRGKKKRTTGQSTVERQWHFP